MRAASGSCGSTSTRRAAWTSTTARPCPARSDFERYLGEPVLVKLYRPRDGQKEFPGRLVRYEDGAVTIEMRGREVTFDKAEVALVRLRVEF